MKDKLEETILTIEGAIETTKKAPIKNDQGHNYQKGILFGLEWALKIAKEYSKCK